MNSIATKAQNGTEPATLRPRIRTLVVDDSPFMLKTLAQILKHAANFDLVGTATNGCQGLRQVSALWPDLVLMDVHLPCLNGIQATQCIKQREHPPVVVIMTSDDRSLTKAMAEKAGADGFLSKAGDLKHRLMGVLEDLFGPNGASRAPASDTSFRNQPPSKPGPPHMKTPTNKNRPRELASGDAALRHLKIHLWPPVRFSQPVLIRPARRREYDFREVHGRMRSARARTPLPV